MKFTNEEQIQSLMEDAVHRAMIEREKSGQGVPAILMIDASDAGRWAFTCFNTLDEFEMSALEHGEHDALEKVRDALAHVSGKTAVFFKWDGGTRIAI